MRDQLDATNSDLFVISCSSTCLGHLYAHHQEVRLCFSVHCEEEVAWLESSNFLLAVHTSCHLTLQHHNNYNRTENQRQWNAVWPPDDGHKDARNMFRNNWLQISLFVASSWSRPYLVSYTFKNFCLLCLPCVLCMKSTKYMYIRKVMYFPQSHNFINLIFDWLCIISIYDKEKHSTRWNNRQFIKIPKLARHVSGNSYAHLQVH